MTAPDCSIRVTRSFAVFKNECPWFLLSHVPVILIIVLINWGSRFSMRAGDQKLIGVALCLAEGTSYLIVSRKFS